MRCFNLFILTVLIISLIPISFAAKVQCYVGGEEAKAQCNEITDECTISDGSNGNFVVCVIKNAKVGVCDVDVDCSQGQICQDGKCVVKTAECQVDSDCSTDMLCDDSKCIAKEKSQEIKPEERPQPQLPNDVQVSGSVVSGSSAGGVPERSIVFEVKKEDEKAKVQLKIITDKADNIEKPKLDLNLDVKRLQFIPNTIDIGLKDFLSRVYIPTLFTNLLAIVVVLGFIVKDFVVVPPRRF